MRERSPELTVEDPLDELFEPALAELADDDLAELLPASSTMRSLTEKRRRAEERLEVKRLRDELGDYDLQLDDL
jgi:hypothetical protein